MSLLWILIIILLVVWASGYGGWPYPGYRGNNLVHIVLAIVLILLLVQLLGGGNFIRIR